jgi:hypothetical protein
MELLPSLIFSLTLGGTPILPKAYSIHPSPLLKTGVVTILLNSFTTSVTKIEGFKLKITDEPNAGHLGRPCLNSTPHHENLAIRRWPNKPTIYSSSIKV